MFIIAIYTKLFTGSRVQHTEKAFVADTALQILLDGFFKWADRWNLNADWFLLRALKTLKYWEKHDSLRLNLQWSMSLPLTADIEDEPNPPEGFPVWDEWRESRKQYVQRITKMAKDSIEKDPILSKGKRLRKTALIDSISEVANQYCESIIKLYEQKNYRRIRERPSAALHIEWLVDFQINKIRLKEIAEDSRVDIRAVTKAVKNSLKILELKKRTANKGRPRGSTDTKKRPLIVRHIK
jgi:hypothetical protein